MMKMPITAFLITDLAFFTVSSFPAAVRYRIPPYTSKMTKARPERPRTALMTFPTNTGKLFSDAAP